MTEENAKKVEEVRTKLLDVASQVLGKITANSMTKDIQFNLNVAIQAFEAATRDLSAKPDGDVRGLRGPKGYGDPPPDPG